jgi:hypothetical protein
MKRIIFSILIFVILVAFYEYFVHLWSLNEIGAIIRVDILIVYPIIIGVSGLTYYILVKRNKKRHK